MLAPVVIPLIFALVYVIAAASPADQLQLPTSSKRFVVDDLNWINLFKASSIFLEDQCAGSTIVHRGHAKCQGNLGMMVIPHSVIFHDGIRCGTGNGPEYTLVVPSEMVIDAQSAAINKLLGLYRIMVANERARNAFKVLDDIDTVHVGFEYGAPRKCGPVTFPKNTVYIFITPTPGKRDINFGFAYLQRGEVGMLSFKPSQALCMYKETRFLGPGQPKYASPTPSPKPAIFTFKPSTFNFTNPSGLPACFPVVDFSVAKPSPSQTPSTIPSVLVSLQPTPSMSPSTSLSPSPTNNASYTPSPSQIAVKTNISSPSPSNSQVAVNLSTPTASVSPLTTISDRATVSPSPTKPQPSPTAMVSPSMKTSKSPQASESPVVSPTASKSVGSSPATKVSPTPLVSSGSSKTTTASVAASPAKSTAAKQTVSPSASTSPRGASTKRACFPRDAIVQVESGIKKRMQDLHIGNRVLVRQGLYSSVIAFTHNDGGARTEMVSIRVSSGLTVTLSGSHYVGVGPAQHLKAASDVEIGESLTMRNGSLDSVTAKWTSWKYGLFNPQTVDGWIVVNGLVISTFTQAVQPAAATALLAPVKFLFRLGIPLPVVSHWLTHGSDELPSWVRHLIPRVSTV